MVYRISVQPSHARADLIAQLVVKSNDKGPFPYFQNKPQSLPQVRLPANLPVYRMSNGRTRTAQLHYLRSHGKSASFFTTGQESQEVQQAQHDILSVLANEGRATSIVPIKDVLASDKQTEPLLISSTGIVVNGNRRLAGMRELYAEDGAAFASFSHVECLVLPSTASEAEIKEIEVRMQMQPDTKLPYGWINEALTVRDLMAAGFNRDQIATWMRKRPPEIDQALRAVGEGEIYLRDWLGRDQDYSVIESDAQQLFNDLAKAIEKKNPQDQEASRQVAFLLADQRGKLGRRVYDYNFSFGKSTTEVVELLASRLDIDLSPVQDDADSSVLEIDLGGGPETSSYQPLLDALGDPAQRQKAADLIVDICEEIRDAADISKRGQMALTTVAKAQALLTEVDIGRADPATYRGIRTQLSNIEALIGRLTTNLDQAEAPQTPSP